MTNTLPKNSVNSDFYERLYQQHADPWNYELAAEQAKYQISLDAAQRWQPTPHRVLETACSLGYQTALLAGYAPEVYAYDLSETAVELARQRCQALETDTRFDLRTGDVTEPGYPNGFFDVVFLQDVLLILPGLGLRKRALRKALEMLDEDGVLVMTDYQRAEHQETYCRLVENAGGQILEKIYFHDRGWFRLKSVLREVRRTAPAKALLRSQRVYRLLRWLSSRRGPEGSKHFGLVVQRAG